jgi:hypothetical protein
LIGYMASSFFNSQQREWVGEALEKAETLVGGHFQIDLADLDRFPYDVCTLAALRRHEKTRRALAQVCKYEVRRETEAFHPRRREFYRICLQDDKILNTTQTEPPDILKALLLYVVTHEIIHVTRFSLEPGRFYLDSKEKGIEEKYVHRMTYEILKSFADPYIEPLLERYRPWWGESRSEAQEPGLDNTGRRV